MHPDTTYEITTHRADTRVLHPEPLARPPMTPAEIPPGVELVTLPNGVRTLAYTQPTTPTTPVDPTSAGSVPVWAKTTALLAPTVGGGIAAAGVGLSYAAPGLIAMTEALWAAVALIATGGITTAALLGRARRPAPAHITQHITATGLFGRANGTINHH